MWASAGAMVWTQHASDEGVPYWYDASTGVSTWQKPAGFRPTPSKSNIKPNSRQTKAKSTRFKNTPARPKVSVPKARPAPRAAGRPSAPKANLRRSSIAPQNPPGKKLIWASLISTVLVVAGLAMVLATQEWQKATLGGQGDVHVGLLEIKVCSAGTCVKGDTAGDYKATGEVTAVWGISAVLVLGSNLIVAGMLACSCGSATPQGLTDVGLVCAFLGTVLWSIAWTYYLKHFKEDASVQMVGDSSLADHELSLSFIFAVVIGMFCFPYTFLFHKLRDDCIED